MSWDVFVFNAPPHIATMDEIPIDFLPPPLGAASDVGKRLRESVEAVDLTDPTWCRVLGETWSIELSLGADDPVEAIMLYVRGGGDDVLTVIARIAAAVEARALDISTGEFLTGDLSQTAGWHGFQRGEHGA